MSQNIGIITQARTTSTRLPGKVLLKANGKTVLEHHIDRLRRSGIPVYIATTINSSDDSIIKIANNLNVPCFRGDEHNVLERFYGCAKQFNLDVIIRVTSDCPLIDGSIIRQAVDDYLKLDFQDVYLSNALERTYPRGLDFEIFSFKSLTVAFQNAVDSFDKEHVTPYINKNKAGNIKVQHFKYREDLSELRWTLDTTEDWLLLRILIEEYKAESLTFEDILKIVRANDRLLDLNKHIKQKDS